MNKYYGQEKGPALWAGRSVALITTCGYPPEKGADLWEEGVRRYCRHSKLNYMGILVERHMGYQTTFMDEKKKSRAAAFAQSLYHALFAEKQAPQLLPNSEKVASDIPSARRWAMFLTRPQSKWCRRTISPWKARRIWPRCANCSMTEKIMAMYKTSGTTGRMRASSWGEHRPVILQKTHQI